MRETMQRWKARLGSLKPVLALVLVFAVLAAYRGAAHLGLALNNRGAPQTVTLAQLVAGSVGTGRYIDVSGLPAYDLGYDKTVDGETTALYYFLIDPDDGAAVLVKHPSPQLAAQQDGLATITGMTRSAPADLQAAVRQDERQLTAHGRTTTPQLYVEDGALPPEMGGALLVLAFGVSVAGLCLAGLFLPRTAFVSYPLATTASTPEDRFRVSVTGTFTQLNSVEPLELGKRTRKFTDAVANVIPLSECEVLLYIKYVLKTKTYGMTAKTVVTDWGVYLHSDQDVVITSGKLLGWKDEWAVRIQHSAAHGKPVTLYLVFADAGAQATCVGLLRARRFTIRKRLQKFRTASE